MRKFHPFLFIAVLLFTSSLCFAQEKKSGKYPSLLWEITGNGLKKPSYLFGTMHVSSKLAFHLSDSFYYALKNVDAVALELNPESWQPQMVRLNSLNQNYVNYVQRSGIDFLTENSFRINKIDDNLKSALNTEPPVVNSLLYRSYQTKEDFEEDTFLDLYIFQTGRKLGKRAAGVEDYYESEKLVMEAYADMAKEKKKKNVDLDGETMTSLLEKMQNAYRRGDLDLMDSLDNKMESSPAFKEKFLYKRNEIQANSIDSIIKKSSLFAGVGAAHLPGERGVIELLRKMGYKLRPIKMTDRDAAQKDNIDQLKVPVKFTTQKSEDGMYTVDVPGQLYVLRNFYLPLDRSQFADMNNGSYYLVTRIKTYAGFHALTEDQIKLKIDSVLYENIPGKILTKTVIKKNGYSGYDISNRTRRGDLQRYQIFVTPFEIIVFKMSGKNNYVAGQEAEMFFNSIQLKPLQNVPVNFSPTAKGFSINLPQQAHEFYDGINEDRWEWEARDSITNSAYLIIKKSIYNYQFIEEDSFNLSLIEESFRNPDFFEKQISREQTSVAGFPALKVREQLKDGHFINAVYIIKGPHYYAFTKRTKHREDSSFAFINSLKWEAFSYLPAQPLVDSFYKFKVRTHVQLNIDEGIRTLIEQANADKENGNNASGYMSYWLKDKNAILKSDTTGEMVSVLIQEYPKYFYITDSAKYWKNVIQDNLQRNDMVLESKSALQLDKGSQGYYISIRDTGSATRIEKMIVLKNQYLYTLSTVTDTLSARSEFVQSIFGSFSPLITDTSFNPYQNKLTVFFEDLFSKDSALHKKAYQAIPSVYYGKKGIDDLYNAIGKLNFADKDYLDTKSKLIAELGYIKDSLSNDLPQKLFQIYQQTADTSLFQNEVVLSLARLKTDKAYAQLKTILLQDPPVFTKEEEYEQLFDYLNDSLKLTANLFPDLLKLTTLYDYKERISELLLNLVDSGFIQAKNYKDYFSSIYIDAKVAQKKQKVADEQRMQANIKREEENDEDDIGREYAPDENKYGLNAYSVLLMPFYDKDKNVQEYMKRLLSSKDDYLKMNTVVLLLKNKKEVNDSIFAQLMNNEKLVAQLYKKLSEIKRLDKFPAAYKKQEIIAKSFLRSESSYEKMDSIAMLDKMPATIKNDSGWVYFFKYRIKKLDDWKMGMSGLQPMEMDQIGTKNELTILTGKKFKDYESTSDQFSSQLKRVLFSYRKSAKNFFVNERNYIDYGAYDYED